MFVSLFFFLVFFFFNDTATTEIYTLSLHDALPIYAQWSRLRPYSRPWHAAHNRRSEEHTSELQSLRHIVCRLLLEKKKKKRQSYLNKKKKKRNINKTKYQKNS